MSRSLDYYLIILSQVLGIQRFAEWKFLRMSEGQIFAHSNAGIECLDTKVHSAVNISQVRELDPAARSRVRNITNNPPSHTSSIKLRRPENGLNHFILYEFQNLCSDVCRTCLMNPCDFDSVYNPGYSIHIEWLWIAERDYWKVLKRVTPLSDWFR